MRADRCVDAAGPVQLPGPDHLVVQGFTHAVQALEFVLFALPQLMDGGQGQGIVGGELRVNAVLRRQQFSGAGQIRDIGINLAGVHRVAGLSVHLGTLDFGIPVSALDEPDHETPLAAPGQVDQEIDDERAALLVRLHHDAQPVPATEVRIKGQGLDEIQRQLHAVGFFGVDVQPDVVLAGQHHQGFQSGKQLGQYPVALGAAVARMDGRELDGYARSFNHATAGGSLANGVDGAGVIVEVAPGVSFGHGRFAQHVIAEAVTAGFAFPAVGQCLVNGFAGDKLAAQHAHGQVDAFADQRFATFGDQARQCRGKSGFAVGADQFAGDQQSPGCGVDEKRLAFAQVAGPVAPCHFVTDQPVGRCLVGNAQEGFGEAHQGDAFFTGQ